MMMQPNEPFPDGVSAIVHTRNEARHMGDCLTTLKDWTDEILVCDMESADQTVEIARQYTDQIIEHPHLPNFDRARNVSAMRARYRWVFYLDADERVPPGLGPALRDLIAREGALFEAALIPFRHHFAGHAMQCLYPGYTAPRLLKNGKFVFRTRLHAGADVDGRTIMFPADNPDLALVHYSFDSMAHYLEKLNRYTDGEAANMHRDGQAYHWQRAVAHFVEDFQSYYDRAGATRDGVHGFLYSFFSAFYRFEQHAKLYERRFQHKQLQPAEESIPVNVEQVLEFALAVARQKPRVQAQPPQIAPGTTAARVLWSGPLRDPSGYGEESRNFLLALDDAGVCVAGHAFPWSHEELELSGPGGERLARLTERSAAPGFVQIVQDFPFRFQRHPQAKFVVGRTMFETDRLPSDWVEGCNRMDAVWVPSEFNRQTFTDAGVAPEKLAVIPGCLDPAVYESVVEPTPLVQDLKAGGEFLFLSVFDWTLHKGWDVLLRGFLEAFPAGSPVKLLLKVWSTNGYTSDQIHLQATAFAQNALGIDLAAEPRVRFLFDRLPSSELLALYQGCDGFVLPSRGEGWGRPYMEAMACGKPTIGTNWSGNTAFMTPSNSFLVDCKVVPVPETGWREVVTYRGHRWAEPDLASLCTQLQLVVSSREEATVRGAKARQYVLETFSRAQVGARMAAEIARLTTSQGADRDVRKAPHHRSSQPASAPASETMPVADREPVQESGKTRRKGKGPAAPASATAARLEPASDSSRSADQAGTAMPAAVRLEGAAFMWHSLAHVNRQIALGLLRSDGVELSLAPTEPNQLDPARYPDLHPLIDRVFAPLSRPADVHVRHFFPPRFERPAEGHLALMQPWEYGFLPHAWIEPIRENVSEVWCYSEYVREVYRASGIPEERLQVIPLGVDTDVFRPSVPPYVFTTETGAATCASTLADRFVFLFVGGSLERKGIDILLEAYQKAFSAYDDVCLVIKDTGTQTVYQGQNARERILALTADPTRPAILYLEQDLPEAQLAGLYTASNCVVLPYRGEGFCLPALEALASGVPVIVPRGGPTDDFVDESVGWQVKAEKRPFGNGRIGHYTCVGPTWMWEVSPHDLGRQMRQVFQQPDEARRRGTAGRSRAETGWTWKHTCSRILDRIDALRKQPLSAQGAPAPLPDMRVKQTARKSTADSLKLPESPPRDRRAIAKMGARKRALPTLSLCMIVKNEERVLDACLKSIKPFVDEIVLVDTGSTDETIEIAKSHDVKLHHFPWCDDFSAARNVSLSHATCDWVLWMDADDTIPEACGNQLHELLLTAESATTGYIMQVHIPPAPGDQGFTIVDHVKIFRNRSEHRFEGRIHEQILEAIYRAGGRIERTDLYVVHSGYDYSPEGQKHKRERDLRIIDLDIAARPKHPFPHFNKGMTHHHLKHFDLAIESLEQSLSLSKPHESTVRKIYAMLASCHLERGEPERAKQRIEEGFALTPRDPELLFRAGAIYRVLGDMAAAEQCYLHLLNARETGHIDSLDVSMTGYKAHHNLALLYQDMQRWADAENQWRAAVANNPQFLPSWLGLAGLFLQTRRFADVAAVATHLAGWAPEEAAALRQQLAAAGGG